MRIAFVGLGLMGAPIAANLIRAGHRLQVCDLRREAAEALLAAGAEWSEDPARVAMTLQEERAGVRVRVPSEALKDALGD